MFYHLYTVYAVLSFWALDPCDSLTRELILWSIHTSFIQSTSTVSGCQEAMGWIMTKVLGTLSFSSHGIPSSHFPLADPGAFPHEAAEATWKDNQKPLSARQEGTINKSSNLICIITSISSMEVW